MNRLFDVWPAVALALLAASIPAQKPVIGAYELLDAVELHPSGNLRVPSLRAAFLPEDCLKRSRDKVAPKLTIALHRGDKEIKRWPMVAHGLKTVFASVQSKGAAISHTLSDAGDYELRIELDGAGVIGQLPLKVAIETGGDPFAPTKSFYVDGPWSQLACLAAGSHRGPGGPISFHLWLRGGPDAVEEPSDEITLRILKDGVPMFFGESKKLFAKSNWATAKMALRHPKKQGHGKVTQAELCANDGRYVAVVERAGKLYGAYPFTVADGKLAPHARSSFALAAGQQLLPRHITSAGHAHEQLTWCERVTSDAAQALMLAKKK